MFKSIRTRLTIWYVGVLAVFVVAVCLIIYWTLVTTLDRDLDLRLAEIANSVNVAVTAEEKEMESEGVGESARSAVKEIGGEMRMKDFPFIAYSPGGEVIVTTADFERDLRDASSNVYSDITLNGTPLRTYRTHLDLSGQRFELLVFHSLAENQNIQRQLGITFLILISLTLLVAAIVGYFLARKALAPVGEMGRQAETITANNLDERLIVRNPHDELGQLATVMNDLLARLDASFEQQKRFMADASHELRSPLAVVRGESEISLSKTRTPDEYRESLSVIKDESERLTKIVEDLFTLARADAGQFAVNFEPVYLNDIVAESVRSISVLARARNVTIEVTTNGEMPMSADDPLLRRLFMNLLDNAVKYNRDGGTVSVSCEKSGTSYRVQIADTGVGINPDEQPFVFDRFYRSDKSRSRGQQTNTSGAGLGLAISQWIAETHDGKIELVSSSVSGSTFSVTLPC